MKRTVISTMIVVCFALGARAALDTYALTDHDQVLAAQATTLNQEAITLLAPQVIDAAGAVVGDTNTVTAYKGKALLVAGIETGTVTVLWGRTAATLGTLGTNTFSGPATIEGVEVDLDTLMGTNAAMFVRASATNSAATSNSFACGLIVLTPRTALQTITGSAVDTITYKGYGTIIVSIGTPLTGATNFSGVVSIQRAAASTGTWATVTNLTGTVTATGNTAGAATRLPYEFGVGGRYIRAVFTTTNDAAAVCVTVNSFN